MAALTIGQAFERAVAFHQAGQLAQAEAIYRQIIAQVPQHADALHLLGLIAVATGHADQGADWIRRAITCSPAQAVYHANLGVALHRLGRHEEALACLTQSMALNPTSAETCCNLGEVLHSLDRTDEAIANCRRALALRPDYPDAHNMLGVVLAHVGQAEQAVAAYRAALGLRPGFAEAHNNLGCAFLKLGRLEEARECFGRAVALRADYAMAHKNLGGVLAKMERPDLAIPCFRRALELRPDDAETWNYLGDALMRNERAPGSDDAGARGNPGGVPAQKAQREEAIQCFRRAVAAKPDDAEAWNNLGNALVRNDGDDEAAQSCRRALELKPDFAEACGNLGSVALAKHDCDEAVAYFRRALEMKPALLEAHANLGACFLAQGRFGEAIDACRRALDQNPDFAPAHWNLSHALLLLGRHGEGWREYEWRWQCPPLCDSRREFRVPQWDGTPVPGQAILLHAEQGFGDTIQFLRYISIVRERAGGARLIVECHPILARLIDQTGGWDAEILARDESRDPPVPPHDFHLPFLSLPFALGMPEPLRVARPYLRASDSSREVWRQRLATAATLRVGIAWEGNPEHRNHHRRSIPLGKLTGILRIPGVTFCSLQLAPSPAQSQALADAGVLDLTAHITDFADTAAMMAELDLIITVDTAAAHLAGALGRPVWTLLPFVPDWRWGLEKEDTPWYPTMRLFRQMTIGDWDSVILRVAEELGSFQTARLGN